MSRPSFQVGLCGALKAEVFSRQDAHVLIDRKSQRFRDGAGIALALTNANTDEAVGQISINIRPQPGVVGLGYWVLPEARQRGFASRAARLAATWALGPLGAVRVEAWVRTDNAASLRTIAAAGFTARVCSARS